MKRCPTTLGRLCDVLNKIGIRTTNVAPASRKPSKQRTVQRIEEARRQAPLGTQRLGSGTVLSRSEPEVTQSEGKQRSMVNART